MPASNPSPSTTTTSDPSFVATGSSGSDNGNLADSLRAPTETFFQSLHLEQAQLDLMEQLSDGQFLEQFQQAVLSQDVGSKLRLIDDLRSRVPSLPDSLEQLAQTTLDAAVTAVVGLGILTLQHAADELRGASTGRAAQPAPAPALVHPRSTASSTSLHSSGSPSTSASPSPSKPASKAAEAASSPAAAVVRREAMPREVKLSHAVARGRYVESEEEEKDRANEGGKAGNIKKRPRSSSSSSGRSIVPSDDELPDSPRPRDQASTSVANVVPLRNVANLAHSVRRTGNYKAGLPHATVAARQAASSPARRRRPVPRIKDSSDDEAAMLNNSDATTAQAWSEPDELPSAIASSSRSGARSWVPRPLQRCATYFSSFTPGSSSSSTVPASDNASSKPTEPLAKRQKRGVETWTAGF